MYSQKDKKLFSIWLLYLASIFLAVSTNTKLAPTTSRIAVPIHVHRKQEIVLYIYRANTLLQAWVTYKWWYSDWWSTDIKQGNHYNQLTVLWWPSLCPASRWDRPKCRESPAATGELLTEELFQLASQLDQVWGGGAWNHHVELIPLQRSIHKQVGCPEKQKRMDWSQGIQSSVLILRFLYALSIAVSEQVLNSLPHRN